MAASQPYRPDPRIEQIADFIADPVDAAAFPAATLRWRNGRAAETVGLGGLSDAEWIDHLARFTPLSDNLPRPLALRYHGHQFRSYNPELGDGRGFLFAQVRETSSYSSASSLRRQGPREIEELGFTGSRDASLRWHDGRLLDLGTKGSGTTPYSRFGDGRLTLKGGLREVLATEMLEALGVHTSKTFSLVETGEALTRGDEPSPTRSAVLVRLSHGHIRVGSFERLAALDEPGSMRRLVAYCLHHLLAEPGDDPVRLFALVAERCATLAASYGAAGFVHGVLNTDNINVTGESFDYGPWRWTPYWDTGFTAAYFDHKGLYAFGRQAEAIGWNLLQLARSLALIAEPAALASVLASWTERYERRLVLAILARLGVAPRDEVGDRALARAFVAGLGEQAVTIDRAFYDWRCGTLRAPSALYDGAEWAPFRAVARAYEGPAPAHTYWRDGDPCAMHIDEVEAIWATIAERDDWGPFGAKIAAVRRMGEAHGEAVATVRPAVDLPA